MSNADRPTDACTDELAQEPSEPELRVYRPDELAALLRCSVRTLRNWRRAGLLTAIKIRGSVYFAHQDVLNLIAQMRSDNAMKPEP